jgi:predicted phosphoribosyltransferase/dienelactone hydrolase
MTARFADRRDAGRQLAAQLVPFEGERPVVLALPRGGVPVAVEVARELGAPLDLLVVRKLGAPSLPELAIGAIAEGGVAVVDTEAARRCGLAGEAVDAAIEREERELRRRADAYHEHRPQVDLRGRTVILVDDGLATGLSDLAAIRGARRRGAARVVVGVPVASREALRLVGREADDVVCIVTPPRMRGVSRWYDDFGQVSDEEVAELLDAAGPAGVETQALDLELADVTVPGELSVPPSPRGVVVFAHGSGSSRLSPRNRMVATTLNRTGFATMLFDLLTEEEAGRRELVFDIGLLAGRLGSVIGWVREDGATRGLPIGLFGASTGAAAALRAAADAGDVVGAVVSRGGRPDLAADSLARVHAATLLLVGSRDRDVLELNRRAATRLRCEHRLDVIEGATHVFPEPGALEAVAGAATAWFAEHLAAAATRGSPPHRGVGLRM